MPRTRFVVAVVLTAVMVLSAGCAGFGTDDPSEVSNGNADGQVNESSINDTEATNESSEESDGDSNEYNETDPPESSDGDDPDQSPAASGPDDGGSADETQSTDSAGDAEEGDDADSGTNSDQEDTSSSDDDNGDAANDGDADAPSEDGNGDDAPSENGGDGDGGEDSPESGDETANGDDAGNESGEEEQVYTLTVEADSPVTLERTWEDASTTREPTNGTVEFSVIEGSYTLSADGYHDVPEELAIHVDSDTTVTMQSEDGGEIEVNVVDADTGEPIEGAEISGVCDWYYSSGDVYVTGETDADGVATAYAELAPTDCDATVSAEGYESESVALSIPDDDGLTVELEPEESEAPETNTLTVEVTDAETDEPIEGATVEA